MESRWGSKEGASYERSQRCSLFDTYAEAWSVFWWSWCGCPGALAPSMVSWHADAAASLTPQATRRRRGGRKGFGILIRPDMIRKQLTILASWTFSAVGQAECARFIADRKLPVERLFTHHFTLEQAEEAYRLFDTQTTGKGVFAF
jgi:hypothetical protein